MPSIRIRSAAGMVMLACVLGGCGQGTAGAPSPTPSESATPAPTAAPTPAGHNWEENLAFAGDLSGRMATVVASAPNQVSECTGVNSRSAGTWSSAVYGDVGGTVYGVVIVAGQYRGPGTYKDAGVSVQVTTVDHTRVWQSVAADPVTFTVNADETSGTLDASLDNLTTGKTSLKVSGTWTCR